MDKTATDGLKVLNQRMKDANLRGQWTGKMPVDGPTPPGDPFIWRYDEVLAYAHQACDALPDSEHARRSLMFCNPSLPRDITHTIGAGIQLIQAGEIASPHRHSASALRFVIDGDRDMVTVVDGVDYPMENYDLILTPNWYWHGHHNRTDRNITWLDVLDLPSILSLNQMFYEPGDIGLIDADRAPSLETPSEDDLGGPTPKINQMRFSWDRMNARLQETAAAGDGDPFDGVTCDYHQPDTGGPTLPTAHCRAHLLKPGAETKRHRHSSMAVYFVIDGDGETVVGDTTLKWSKHDAFCVPNWAWHHHLNPSMESEALLFSVDDSPVLNALGLLRVQSADN